MNKDIVIGTRGSKLALWQAKNLQKALSEISVSSQLNIIKTKGDRVQDLSFDKLEGKGFFTKEIEEALLDGSADIAVHSLKDLPTTSPEGLTLAGLSQREDPSDLLIVRKDISDPNSPIFLKEGAIVGTSSIRRKTQIKDLAPHIEVQDLRGNVPTRIGKLADKKYDAIILASAGINRLEIDLSEFNTKRLNPEEFVPAPAQGVIAYQTRASDKETRRILAKIHNKETARATNVERKVLQLMDGGCQMPLGVYCTVDQSGNYHAMAAYAKEGASEVIRARISQSTSLHLAERLVDKLIS